MEGQKTRMAGMSIRRALRVLSSFSLDGSILGVSEIARKTGLPKSTVHWLLRILEQEGFVCQDLKTLKYRLGIRLFHLGTVAKSAINLDYVSQPVMERLRDITQETVNLYVLDGYDRVCIKQAEGLHLVRQAVRVGQKVPAYCGAASKVLLAWQPEEFIEEIIAVTKLKPLTKNTISDPELFRTELARVRGQGYAISLGERDIDVVAIATPIFDEEGKIIASLSVSGPASRFEITQEAIEEAKKAAAEISHHIGAIIDGVMAVP